MFLIRSCILEQPDVEDLLRIFCEVVLLKPINCPFHGICSSLLNDFQRFITNNDEWWLNNNREVSGRSYLLELGHDLINVPGKISLGELCGTCGSFIMRRFRSGCIWLHV